MANIWFFGSDARKINTCISRIVGHMPNSKVVRGSSGANYDGADVVIFDGDTWFPPCVELLELLQNDKKMVIVSTRCCPDRVYVNASNFRTSLQILDVNLVQYRYLPPCGKVEIACVPPSWLIEV